jgi:CxxC motif-containing protein (DUF1111 family)
VRDRFGGRDEVRAGIVDQAGERAALPEVHDHGVHRLGVADVHHPVFGGAARAPGDLRAGVGQYLLAPAADRHMRAMRGEADRHLLAEAGASACHQDALTLQDVAAERAHASSLSVSPATITET